MLSENEFHSFISDWQSDQANSAAALPRLRCLLQGMLQEQDYLFNKINEI